MPLVRALRLLVPLAILAGALAVLLAPARADAAERYGAAAVTPWKTNASPAAWNPATGEVIYNRRGADGLWDAYRAAPDGSGEACMTCATPRFTGVGAATHRGASDVSPDGRHVLLDVERGSHFGKIGVDEAEPGKGAYNDVWLSTRDGSQAWPLTDIHAPGAEAIGTIWPRFDRTGTRIVWAEMYAPSILNLGFWSLKVADIAWKDGTPGLRKVRTYRPESGRFYEPYGFSADNRRIIFASDMGMPSWWDSQIYSVSADFTDLQRLSPADAAPGFFTNYNEFAFPVPAGDRVLYGRTVGAGGGIDYWLMNPDGSGQQRLTFMNEGWHSHGRGFSVAGGIAFDPRNPNRFVAGVAADSFAHDVDAVVVDMERHGDSRGLRAEYFADRALTRRAVTRVENPSAGFKWSGSPAAGIPADAFSVRWSGQVTPAATGSYTYCVHADDGVRLWVGGRRIVDAWLDWSGRRCATVAHTAGRPEAIRLEYWDNRGDGTMQITWRAPGAGGQQPIPAGVLAPAPAPAAPAPARPSAPATAKAPAKPAAKRAAKPKRRAARKAKCRTAKAGKRGRSARTRRCRPRVRAARLPGSERYSPGMYP